MRPGWCLVMVDIPSRCRSSWKLGLAVCFDSRFPKQFVALAKEGGAVRQKVAHQSPMKTGSTKPTRHAEKPRGCVIEVGSCGQLQTGSSAHGQTCTATLAKISILPVHRFVFHFFLFWEILTSIAAKAVRSRSVTVAKIDLCDIPMYRDIAAPNIATIRALGEMPEFFILFPALLNNFMDIQKGGRFQVDRSASKSGRHVPYDGIGSRSLP